LKPIGRRLPIPKNHVARICICRSAQNCGAAKHRNRQLITDEFGQHGGSCSYDGLMVYER
jgi:hypothetical protein